MGTIDRLKGKYNAALKGMGWFLLMQAATSVTRLAVTRMENEKWTARSNGKARDYWDKVGIAADYKRNTVDNFRCFDYRPT